MQKNEKRSTKRKQSILQIHDEKVEFRVGSRVGSLANVKVLICTLLYAIFFCFLDVDVDDSQVGSLANVKVST